MNLTLSGFIFCLWFTSSFQTQTLTSCRSLSLDVSRREEEEEKEKQEVDASRASFRPRQVCSPGLRSADWRQEKMI